MIFAAMSAGSAFIDDNAAIFRRRIGLRVFFVELLEFVVGRRGNLGVGGRHHEETRIALLIAKAIGRLDKGRGRRKAFRSAFGDGGAQEAVALAGKILGLGQVIVAQDIAEEFGARTCRPSP